MSSQKSLQRRSLRSTRIELARDLHDSLAQELVAIGYQLDNLIANLPPVYRQSAREIRLAVTSATTEVRRTLFALRKVEGDYAAQLVQQAAPLTLQIEGDIRALDSQKRQIVLELVRNSAKHSHGKNVKIQVLANSILINDDGKGFLGVGELVTQAGGRIEVSTSGSGTQVELFFP